MRRPSGKRTGRRTRNSRSARLSRSARQRPAQSPRRKTSQKTVRRFAPKRITEGPLHSGPNTLVERSKGARRVLDKPRNRRALLQQPTYRPTKRRLSERLVPARPHNEDAPQGTTRQKVCTRKKAARKAVIIATGYGGINHSRNYKDRQSCRSRGSS